MLQIIMQGESYLCDIKYLETEVTQKILQEYFEDWCSWTVLTRAFS